MEEESLGIGETEEEEEPQTTTPLSTEERLKLEEELVELEKEIAGQEEEVQKYKTEGRTLKGEINYMNSRIRKLNLQLKTIDITLTKVNQEIITTQTNINRTENKIDTHKDALGSAIRSIYEAERRGMAEILLAHNKLSDFFNSINNIALVQNTLRGSLQNIVSLRQELLHQKKEFSLEKDDNETLKIAQRSQKANVAVAQREKERLLKVTKGKESEYQKILDETKKSAAEIRSRIFTLLGGGQLTFEKAYEFAKIAENATGVRAPFILAILNQESNFGKNVGQCRYDKVVPQTGTTVMSSKQIPTFLEIIKELGIDAASPAALVSCPILRDGNHGGAMGPAQFMPSTWDIYKDEIADVTGSNPPSPWNNADAFTATALYLKDSIRSRSCDTYSNQIPNQKQKLLERCAASKYYAGGRWHRYRWVYGEPVVVKAEQYADDIAVLEG